MLILIKNIKDIRTLINQAIKINYKIYQQKRASKASIKTTLVYKVLQQVQKLQYSVELMDFSGI